MGESPRLFEPGDGWVYSNSGFYLLGLVIEKVSGLSYAEFVQKRLVAKAGLKSTRYCPPAQDYPHAAKGYEIEQGGNVPARALNMDHPYSAGAICSTADDLVPRLRDIEAK